MGVRSIVVEVDGYDGGATVVFRAGGPTLRATCSSCGAVRSCAHVTAALAAMAEAATADSAGPPRSERSIAPRSLSSGAPLPRRYEPLLGELRVLIEAMLRAAAGEVTASVDDALRAATRSLGIHPMPGAARVLARASSALGKKSALETALAVTALAEVAATLEGARGDDALAEVAGEGAETARLDDLELVEVSRVRERGPLVWESRLLVDVASGALFREEGPIGAHATLSAGTCGRKVSVSLASREASLDPPRLRLLQYALEPAAPPSVLERAVELASPDVGLPPSLARAPLFGVASPVPVWIAPADVVVERTRAEVIGAGGEAFAMDRARDPAAVEVLAGLLDDGAKIAALAGACHVGVGGVRLAPHSVVARRGGRTELVVLAA